MSKKANYLSGTIGKTMFKTALSMLPGTIAVSGYNLADTYLWPCWVRCRWQLWDLLFR